MVKLPSDRLDLEDDVFYNGERGENYLSNISVGELFEYLGRNSSKVDAQRISDLIESLRHALEAGIVSPDDVENLVSSKVAASQTAATKNDIESIPQFKPGADGPASEFLVHYYQAHIAAGDVFQNVLRKRDPRLMTALDNEFKGRRDELRLLIPTKSDAVSQRIETTLGPKRPSNRRRAAKLSSLVVSYSSRSLPKL